MVFGIDPQPSAAAMTCSMSDSFFLPHFTSLEMIFPLPTDSKMALGLSHGSFPVVTSVVGYSNRFFPRDSRIMA